MNTPSHAILNLFLLGKPQQSEFNLLIVIGGVLPDIPIFLFYFWAKLIARLPEKNIWTEAYYQPFIQNIVALFHSIPLALIGWFIAYFCHWKAVQIFCLSLVLHSLGDLPVHHDDAHRHFFPFSNYRFISPLSYWDTQHYGFLVALVELTLVYAASSEVMPFVKSWIGKILLLLVNILYFISYSVFHLRSLIFRS